MKVYNKQSNNELTIELQNKLNKIREKKQFDAKQYIENKSNILKEFRTCYDNGSFVPETYEQMLEREFMEDNNLKKEEDNL